MSANEVVEDLDVCIEMLRAGASIEQCVAPHPEHADEVRGLLATAAELGPVIRAGAPPDPYALRARVMQEWDRHCEPSHAPKWRLSWAWRPSAPRWAGAIVALALALSAAGMGTVATSANAMPGSALYPVKEVRERTQLWLARSPEERVATYSALVRERAHEIQALTLAGQHASSTVAVARLDDHVTGLGTLLDSASVSDTGLLAEAAAAQLQAGLALQDAWEAAPEEARPTLERALAIIGKATSRVDAALEDLGPLLDG